MRILIFIVLFLVPGISWSATGLEKNTLKGHTSMVIVVWSIDEPAIANGLTEEDLKAKVDQRLRRIGISDPADLDSPDIEVKLHIKNISQKHCIFSMSVDVKQNAILHPSRRMAFASTWRTSDYGLTPCSNIKANLLYRLDMLLNEFSLDYLEANPRATTTPKTP